MNDEQQEHEIIQLFAWAARSLLVGLGAIGAFLLIAAVVKAGIG